MSRNIRRRSFGWLIALGVLLVFACSTPAVAGGLAIKRPVMTDDGDNDGYADTNETVAMRLVVQNTSGVALTGVSVHLTTDDPGLLCVTNSTINVGDLGVGETRTTTEALVFSVADVDRTGLGLGPLDELFAVLHFSVTSAAGDLTAHPEKSILDLDLDVSSGSGATSYLEDFEPGTLGSFSIDNMDQGRNSFAGSDGFRCQYNDPDWEGSNAYDPIHLGDCYLGAVPSGTGGVLCGGAGLGAVQLSKYSAI